MKRLISFVCALLACSLAWAAIAAAATSHYSGTADTDPAATVSFVVKQRHGVTKLANPQMVNFLANCTDPDGVSNPEQRRISLAGRGATIVKHKRFTWRATQAFVSTMTFKGKLQPGGTAAGTAEFFGDIDTPDGTKYCETGTIAWHAVRA